SHPSASKSCGRGAARVWPGPTRGPTTACRSGPAMPRSGEPGRPPGPEPPHHLRPRQPSVVAWVLSSRPSINYALAETFNPSKSLGQRRQYAPLVPSGMETTDGVRDTGHLYRIGPPGRQEGWPGGTILNVLLTALGPG